jgi:hypothetical protein
MTGNLLVSTLYKFALRPPACCEARTTSSTRPVNNSEASNLVKRLRTESSLLLR